jgi:hypothetical protein
MPTLIPVIAGLGLAVAFTSPGSVVTMIVLLSRCGGQSPSSAAGFWRSACSLF